MKKKRYVFFTIVIMILVSIISGCKNEEKMQVLNWAIVGITGFETEESIPKEKVTELNQLLAEKRKDYQIKFHIITFNEGMISEEDEKILKKCDLITLENQKTFTDKIKVYPTLLEFAENNIFEPLDKYLNTENGKKIKKKMLTDLTLQTGYWEGKQWVLPTSLPLLEGRSLRIKRELYEKSEWEKETVPDFTRCDELFEKLYIANEKKPFLVFSDRKTVHGRGGMPGEIPYYLEQLLFYGGDIGEDDGLGAGALKEEGNNLDTRNLLREPYFEEYLNAWRRYIEKGYVYSDMNVKPLVEIWDSYVPIMSSDFIDEEWIIPKSENYMMILIKQPAGALPCIGIGAESERKQLAFEALTDMILDQEINEIIQTFDSAGYLKLVFNRGILEDEKEYKKLVQTVPQFVVEHTFDTITIPEIGEINKVYAEYSTDEDDDSTQKVLERHFSKEGEVTEESIHEGIQRLNEKLDAAGMERFIEALKEEKIKSKK